MHGARDLIDPDFARISAQQRLSAFGEISGVASLDAIERQLV
jgi:hypothetical protein